MTKRWLISATAAAVIIASGVYFYSNDHSPHPLFETVHAEKRTINKQAIAVGKMVPAHSVAIKSQINGIVGKIYVKEGEKVKQGQPLIKVRPNPTPQALTDATTELMQSEASMESARQSLANLQSLVDQNIIPDNYDDYVRAKANLKARKAEVAQKRHNLELIQSGEASVGSARLTSTIYAPIDGTVLNIKVEVGEPIISTESSQSATEMMSLADMSNVIFKGSVSEHDAALLRQGMNATMTVAPYPDMEVKGILDKVAIQSETLNGSDGISGNSFDNGFGVEISHLVIPEGMNLRSGFSATARIILKQVKDVVSLPERVLKFEDETPNVLLPDDSEQGYHEQKVQLGLSDGIHVEVLQGIDDGQTVVDNSMLGDSDD
ncbi:Macrolide export protein MacA [Vibrio aerogenes CECT 7868]|uniref:Macrolide export protein MacA n=1 Tax=Vibrio aerogenes CECT 7868 TaxID=1216006 RepID=A0A1M5XS58_9VIBR|nr:efflux RND transporter periplasmic adaptor subunit [Vibrio aerogenes]SHI02620.1 Macrolide export protein MacA [Vibrio aerogenes CECT 7868]